MRFFRKGLYLVETDINPRGILRAASLAQQHQSELLILDIFPMHGVAGRAAAAAGGEQALIDQIASNRQAHIRSILAASPSYSAIAIESRPGRRYLDAIKVVLQQGFDMVLKTAEARPWLGRTLASDDLHLLRKCPCAVYLMHPDTVDAVGTVVAAIDIDTDDDVEKTRFNDDILDHAVAAAAFEGTELHVVHAWESTVSGFISLWADMPETAAKAASDGEHQHRQATLDQVMASLRHRLDADTLQLIRPRAHLVQGPAAAAIPEQVSTLQATTMVIGTVARTGIPGLIMGNTAEDILRQLQCDVVALKPRGFICPIAP